MITMECGNDMLRLGILPECGGKIRSLMDRRTGLEWLWTNPNLPQVVPEYGQNFERHLDTGGWDELFPSVVPCDVDGIAVPDHGDLVSLPWEVLEQADGVLSMQATARSIPATLRREIRLVDGAPEFLLSYTLTNHADRSQPFLVATHPLFGMEPGSRLDLPDEAVFRIAGVVGHAPVGKLIRAGELNALLSDKSGVWAMKLFSKPGTLSEVGFFRPDGAGIRMSWDVEDLPVLGLWVNHAGWTGTGGAPYRNVGIEPGNASCDALSDAVADGSEGRLEPGEVRTWEVRVSLV
jgi:galactose mutarotase-like enzyme